MPPHARNQRTPTAGDTPAATAASSLDRHRATSSQNLCRCSRRPTGGRPGERIRRRRARSAPRRLIAAIATPPLSSRCCDDRLNSPNTRRSRSGCAAGRSASDPRWARSATRTTTRSARASSRRSSASFSTANASRRRPRRRWPSSPSSRAYTIRAGGTPLSAKSRRSTSNAAMPGRPPRERPLRPVLYSPASRGKLPSPSGEGCSENLSVHPSTKAGQLHIVDVPVPGTG